MLPTGTVGRRVEHLPAPVARAYDEARRIAAIGAWTSVALVCRKLLMHVAVAEANAKEGAAFVVYVDALAESGLVPSNAKAWIDWIRQRGNAATHELEEIAEEDGRKLLAFVEHLLASVYEMPGALGSP